MSPLCLDDLCLGDGPIYLTYATSSLLGSATGKSWQELREVEQRSGPQLQFVSQCQPKSTSGSVTIPVTSPLCAHSLSIQDWEQQSDWLKIQAVHLCQSCLNKQICLEMSHLDHVTIFMSGPQLIH